jgi:hypothetical protein
MSSPFNKISYPKSFTQTTQSLFIITLLLLTLMNAFVFKEEVKRINTFKSVLPHQTIGYKFNGLIPFVKGIEYVGYYTDDSSSKNETAKQYAHAQYILAPTILDYGNLEHKHILLVCSKEAIAWKKMQELGAVPLSRNKYGMILVEKKR